MARAAGSGTHYEFVLRNANNGRYHQDVVIALPSSTTIIKQTLAAPQLVGWAYRTTRDNIAGLVDTLSTTMRLDSSEIVDLLGDGDMLEEYLKENGLRPDDVRDERAEAGLREHRTLETLAGMDPEHAYERAAKWLQEGSQGSERAIYQWWVDTNPTVVSSELILPCVQHGYCGTTDLVWYDGQHEKVVTDLKTRRAELYDYDSDQFQVDSYRVAYNLLHPEAPAVRGSVLLAFDDGTYDEAEVTLPEGEFLKVKAVYDCIQQARAKDKKWGRG
jgi:hypothetical protein